MRSKIREIQMTRRGFDEMLHKVGVLPPNMRFLSVHSKAETEVVKIGVTDYGSEKAPELHASSVPLAR